MLWEEMEKYTELTGEDAEHVPIMKIGTYLDGYEKGIEVLDKIRADIEAQRKEVSNKNSENNELQAFFHGLNDGLKDARDILDKYRKESKE